MESSRTAILLIKKYEGCRLKAYKPLPTELYYTIGYGHYGIKNKDLIITEAEAEMLLLEDVKKFESYVNKWNNIYSWTQKEFDALVSFTFNCGKGNLEKLLQYGKRTKAQIADSILKYNKANGKELKGLTRRRKEEQELFLESQVDEYLSTFSLEELVDMTLRGEFGNGESRKKALGVHYKDVQKVINNLSKK